MIILPSSKQIKGFCLILLLALSMMGCGATEAGLVLTPRPITYWDPDSHFLNTVDSYSIQQLERKAQWIVIGKITKAGEVFNSSMNSDDLSKPHSTIFGIGQLYDFTVERIVKGERLEGETNTILVGQTEGLIFHEPGATITDAEIQQARDGDRPFEIGSEYILFLVRTKYPEDLIVYDRASEIWRFVISEGCVYPENTWGVDFRGPQSLDEFLGVLEQSMLSDAPVPDTEPEIPTLSAETIACGYSPKHMTPVRILTESTIPNPFQVESGTPYPTPEESKNPYP
jgi:hypothetical protein